MAYKERDREELGEGQLSKSILIKGSLAPFMNQLPEYKSSQFPLSLLQGEICEIFQGKFSYSRKIPLFEHRVQAGVPSPQTGFVEECIDLKVYLIKNEKTTFVVRVSGDSMINAGIFSDDLLVVDKAIKATSGKIIIAFLNGGLTVKRLYKHKSTIILCSENKNYPDIKITQNDDFSIWGVVTNAIHSML